MNRVSSLSKDLTVNEQHSSKTEDIYGITEFHESNLKSLFEIDDKKYEQFESWISLISNPKSKRWKKYSELSPVVELKQIKDEERIIQMNIAQLLKAELSKLMVLSTDVTEERKVKAALERLNVNSNSPFNALLAINNDRKV